MLMNWKEDLLLLRWQYFPTDTQIRYHLYEKLNRLCDRSWQTQPKIYLKMHGTQNSQYNHAENKDEGLTLSDLKTYYKAIIIKTVWYRK